MKKIIQLDEKDIAQIIAEKFKCDVQDVTVAAVRETKGYGMAEHDVYECQAEIEISEEP